MQAFDYLLINFVTRTIKIKQKKNTYDELAHFIAFDRMKPLRTSIQKSTVTVEKESWLARRSRIHTPKFSLSNISHYLGQHKQLFPIMPHDYLGPTMPP